MPSIRDQYELPLLETATLQIREEPGPFRIPALVALRPAYEKPQPACFLLPSVRLRYER